jgi:multiple sugar transport system substrate-binding protein
MISVRALKTLALGASMLAALTLPSAAETLTMWARAAAAAPAQGMIDLWNSTHEDKIELTVIPDLQVVTKLATAVQAGDVPDLMSFDLIFMPDFMKAGFLVDLTDLLKDDPNQAKVAQAFKDLATYDGKLYGTGFLPDVSILLWNKGLFKQAGLDPEKPRRSVRLARMSTGTTSPVTAAAATSSPRRRACGVPALISCRRTAKTPRSKDQASRRC